MSANPLHPNLNAEDLALALSGHNFIDGELAPARSGRTFAVINPATGRKIADAPFSVADDVDLAVHAAQRAQREWANTPARRRGALVIECARLLASHVEELARLVTLETGKAIRTESRPEAEGIADMLQYYGGLAPELKGETVPHRPDVLTLTVREPLGVVGAILPWNAPMYILAMKIGPSLVAGNTVVVKSAEEAPLAVLRVCQILSQVLPKGVLNVVAGYGPECGAPLVAHPGVHKVTFTGSVETGKIIYKTAADKLIPVTLELGGKSPMIVMPDADLDQAAAGAVAGMRFTRQGQSCSASSRMIVHESVHDAFVGKVKALVDAMKIGDPMDEATDIGTIISPAQYDKVCGYIEAGRSLPGTTAVECSTLPADLALGAGLFIRPVMFTGLTNDSKLAREEIFGPVVCVMKFSSYRDALAMANDTDYGLTASVWTRDLKTAMDASLRLQAGFVQVNQNLVAQPGLSYGGYKNSGLGKEASLEAMLDHFTQMKTILVNLA